MRSGNLVAFAAAVFTVPVAAACGAPPQPGAVVPELTPSWTTPWQSGAPGAPLVTAERVVVADDAGNVRAMATADGSEQWSTTLPGALTTAPVTSGNAVFVATAGGDIRAFDLATGDTLWTTSIGFELAAGLASDDGRVFASGDAGTIAALSAASGDVLWTAPVTDRVLFTPLARAGALLVVGFDGVLARLDAATGELAWSSHPDSDYIIGTPLLEDGTIVAPGYGDTLFGVSFEDGSTVWSRYGGNYLVALPAVDRGVAYFGSAQGPIYALELADGSPRWIAPDVLFGRQAVLLPTESHVLVMDLGGRTTWVDRVAGVASEPAELDIEVAGLALTDADDMLVVAGESAVHGFELVGAL